MRVCYLNRKKNRKIERLQKNVNEIIVRNQSVNVFAPSPQMFVSLFWTSTSLMSIEEFMVMTALQYVCNLYKLRTLCVCVR